MPPKKKKKKTKNKTNENPRYKQRPVRGERKKKKRKSKIQLNKQCPVAVKPKTKRNSQPKKYKTKAICIQRVQKLLPWVFLWNTFAHFSLPFSLQFGKIVFWSSKEKTPKSYRNLSRFSALTKQPQIPFSPYSLFIIFYPPIITLIEP